MSTGQGSDQKPKIIEFEAMHLQVGGRLQFITHRGIKPVQHFSTLIGYVKDEYMIVKIPMESGVPLPLGDGDKLTIRVFSGVTVCSFACSVQRVFARPLLYAHVSFPDKIQGSSLRAAMRVKVAIPACITAIEGDAAPSNVHLVNLSVTGALIESPCKLGSEAELVNLQFSLLMPPMNREIVVKTRAAIKNESAVKTSVGQLEIFTYGVEFIDLDPNHYSLLQNLTYEALIGDRQKIV
ncbi:MAG: flagellar brake protein [Pseudomonadota bacterium]